MYKLVTLTTVMLLLLLPGGHGEGQEVKVDQAQCEAACDMGIYYDGCKCFRQLFRWGKRSSPMRRSYPLEEEDLAYPSRLEEEKLSRAQIKKLLYEMLVRLR